MADFADCHLNVDFTDRIIEVYCNDNTESINAHEGILRRESEVLDALVSDSIANHDEDAETIDIHVAVPFDGMLALVKWLYTGREPRIDKNSNLDDQVATLTQLYKAFKALRLHESFVNRTLDRIKDCLTALSEQAEAYRVERTIALMRRTFAPGTSGRRMLIDWLTSNLFTVHSESARTYHHPTVFDQDAMDPTFAREVGSALLWRQLYGSSGGAELWADKQSCEYHVHADGGEPCYIRSGTSGSEPAERHSTGKREGLRGTTWSSSTQATAKASFVHQSMLSEASEVFQELTLSAKKASFHRFKIPIIKLEHTWDTVNALVMWMYPGGARDAFNRERNYAQDLEGLAKIYAAGHALEMPSAFVDVTIDRVKERMKSLKNFDIVEWLYTSRPPCGYRCPDTGDIADLAAMYFTAERLKISSDCLDLTMDKFGTLLNNMQVAGASIVEDAGPTVMDAFPPGSLGRRMFIDWQTSPTVKFDFDLDEIVPMEELLGEDMCKQIGADFAFKKYDPGHTENSA